MEEKITVLKDGLKKQLILSGLEEIRNHGISDFSLRRVAQSCGASCAAPYRHFKNKEEFILEIIRYINSNWELLLSQIMKSDYQDEEERLTDIFISALRFRMANPDFRALLMFQHDLIDDEHKKEILKADQPVVELVSKILSKKGADQFTIDKKRYEVSCLLHGTVLMLTGKELETSPETIEMLKSSMKDILKI